MDTTSVQLNAQNVQEPVPPVEPVPPTTEPPKPVEPVAPQPLTEERIQQMIAAATAGAVDQAKQLGRRELQSEQDRNKADLARMQRRARIGEETLGAVRFRVRETDPEMADKIELEELRIRERGRATLEQEESAKTYQEEIVNRFQTNMTQFITDLGIDPTDKRIDWATDAPDLLTAQQKILASTTKIQKENQQTLQTGFDKRLKELEAKIGKVDVEANSVSTAASAGAVAGSDAEFIKKFGAGEIPLNKINKERYEKILEQQS